jgi:hypothetical protein
MGITKSLGIFMDNSIAHLMEFTSNPIQTKTIELVFTHLEQPDNWGWNRCLTHNKEYQQQTVYYKKLGEVIKNYEQVILFGPTDAKLELFNILNEDYRFTNIQTEVIQTDEMLENQQHAFVKAHFQNIQTP